MGCGKTTIGRQLAKELGYTFVDTDSAIETRVGMSIQNFFVSSGEEAFRMQESRLLDDLLASSEPMVVATGGGFPCFHASMERMNHRGYTIYIQLSPISLYNRLQRARKTRPLLNLKSDEELFDYIDEMLNNRENTYLKAKMTVDGLACSAASLKQQLIQMKII